MEIVREPMFLLLLACGVVYLMLGEPGEASMLLGFVFVVIGITLYQERKTERALEALRDMSSPRAMVIREGKTRRIAGREVVRDDIVIVSEGDRVPADAVLLWCNHLMADESLLTGESVPVRKTSGADQPPVGRPGGDDLPFINWGQGWDHNFYTLPYRVAVKHQRRLTEINNFGSIAEEGDEMRDAFQRTVYFQLADVFNRGITPSNAPFLCPDGMYLIDSARPNPVVGVPTWSNEEATGALTEDMLFDVQLNAQLIRAHNGDLMPRTVSKFLIPPAYERVAWRLRETSGTVGTAMNDANWAKGRFNYETVPEFTVNKIGRAHV